MANQYIYNKFGGPGYLNDQNFKLASYYNFSGRGFKKKNSNDIANELIDDYSQALEFAIKNQNKYRDIYLLPKVMPKIIESLKPRNFRLKPDYTRYITTAENVMKEKVLLDWFGVEAQQSLNKAKSIIDALNHMNKDLRLQLDNSLQFHGSRYVKRFMNIFKRRKKTPGQDSIRRH